MSFLRKANKQFQKFFPQIFYFFPHEIFFPKSTTKGPRRNLGQFFIKKVRISTDDKVG